MSIEIRHPTAAGDVLRTLVELGPGTKHQLEARIHKSAGHTSTTVNWLALHGLIEKGGKQPTRSGRGRPADIYQITDAGREALGEGPPDHE